jgi:ribbon-helix-helix CopG family protein
MASPLTLRLDEKTRKRIARIASRKQLSNSEVVRRAIEAWTDLQEPVTSPYQLVSDLIGVVHGRNPKRSTQTGRGFRKLLERRRSRR